MISIIVPIYNTELYLSECLDSIANQDYEKFECILIDDGSTDRSGEIADQYAIKDKRFKVYHLSNGGVSNARNLGIEYSIGNYIVFVDSDDILSIQYLSHLKAEVKDDDYLIVSKLKRFGCNFTANQFLRKESIECKKVDLLNCNSSLYTELIPELYGPTSKLYDAGIIKKNNLRFNPKMKLGEDLCFNLDYLSKNGKVNILNCYDYYYRETPISLTNRKKYPLSELYDAVSYHKVFMQTHHLWDDVRKNYLYKQLGGYLYDALFNQGNTISDCKLHLNTIKSEDLKECLYSFNYPEWLKVTIKYRMYWLFWIVLLISKFRI